MDSRRRWERSRRVAGPLLFAAVYYLLGILSYLGAFYPSGGIAAWWAPSGFAFAILVRTERRAWPPLLIALGAAAAAISFGVTQSVTSTLLRVAADVAEPLVSASLLQRRFGTRVSLRSVREVFAFAVFGGFVGPLVGATVFAVLGALTNHWPLATALSAFAVWGGSAALGAVLFSAPILTWHGWPELPRGARLIELGLLCASLVLLIGAMYMVRTPNVLAVVIAFATFPVLAWAAVRFGPEGASRSALALSLLSIWPWFHMDRDPLQVVAVQSIYALGAFTALTLSALSSEAERQRGHAREQALKSEESLALLETALRTAPFGMAFLDRGLRVARLNDVFASLGNRPAEELIGRTLREAVPRAAPQLQPMVQTVLESGQPVVGRDIQTNAGQKRYWLCSVYPVQMPRGAPWGVGLLLIDVSDRIAAEEERARLYREAQEAIQVRDDFLSIASHELKTPLTPLAMRLHVMRRKAEAGEPIGVEAIDKALRSLRQLTDLITDLLDATRIARGRLELHREPVSLNDVVRESVEAFKDASARHILVTEVPNEPIWVDADRQRLGQVIGNLLDNAIKYSPAGGTVRLSVRPRENEVEFLVSDQGIGIPPEHQERLFERFHRAPNVAHEYGGLGLGLYITRDIVERHGGRIWVESQPGRGSTFHVVLPRLPRGEAGVSLH